MRLVPIASNVTELQVPGGITVLFSYSTPVACSIKGKYYRTSTRHSNTTQRHIKKWLGGLVAVEEKPQEFFDGLLERVVVT